MSGERVFLDTNVIVYAYDRDAGRKREIARDLLIGLWNDGGGVLSSQILQELYVTVTRKIGRPLAADEAAEIVEDFLSWDVIANDGEAVLQAIKIQGGAEILLTEDLSDGRRFGNLIVRNPFAQSGP